MTKYFQPDIEAFHFGYSLSLKARLACQMVERWGGVSGRLNEKEDSAGRAHLRKETPSELVAHAMEVADKLVNNMEAAGWIREVPTSITEQAHALREMKRLADPYLTAKEALSQ